MFRFGSVRAQALILAEIDGVLVGSVNVKLMSDGVGEFGMLVADRKYRGEGIGSALVKHAEKWAREHACHTMRLEIPHSPPLDTSEQEFSEPVVLQDSGTRLKLPNRSNQCIRS